MNKKTYRKLMLAGMVPWRQDYLKKQTPFTDEDRLLRDGWDYVNKEKILKWKNSLWTLLYKIMGGPKKLPGFDMPPYYFQYVEFMAVDDRGRAELYAVGNFAPGISRPYVMRGRQFIRY